MGSDHEPVQHCRDCAPEYPHTSLYVCASCVEQRATDAASLTYPADLSAADLPTVMAHGGDTAPYLVGGGSYVADEPCMCDTEFTCLARHDKP